MSVAKTSNANLKYVSSAQAVGQHTIVAKEPLPNEVIGSYTWIGDAQSKSPANASYTLHYKTLGPQYNVVKKFGIFFPASGYTASGSTGTLTPLLHQIEYLQWEFDSGSNGTIRSQRIEGLALERLFNYMLDEETFNITNQELHGGETSGYIFSNVWTSGESHFLNLSLLLGNHPIYLHKTIGTNQNFLKIVVKMRSNLGYISTEGSTVDRTLGALDIRPMVVFGNLDLSESEMNALENSVQSYHMVIPHSVRDNVMSASSGVKVVELKDRVLRGSNNNSAHVHALCCELHITQLLNSGTLNSDDSSAYDNGTSSFNARVPVPIPEIDVLKNGVSWGGIKETFQQVGKIGAYTYYENGALSNIAICKGKRVLSNTYVIPLGGSSCEDLSVRFVAGSGTVEYDMSRTCVVDMWCAAVLKSTPAGLELDVELNDADRKIVRSIKM